MWRSRKLRAEALLRLHLFLGQLDGAFGGGPLQPQQPLVPGQQPVAHPDPADAARGHLQAAKPQLLFDAQRPVAGMGERVVEHRLLDLGGHPVGVRPLGAGQPVDQPIGPIGLEVAPDLVELLA